MSSIPTPCNAAITSRRKCRITCTIASWNFSVPSKELLAGGSSHGDTLEGSRCGDGRGWTGSILARELTKGGLSVVGLERGPDRVPGKDFTLRGIRDELKWGRRSEIIQDNA